MSLEYTIILRGQPFILTEDLISADEPNYFTACFKGGYTENETRIVKLGRSPALFTLIVDHLSGYDILPIQDNALPPNMNQEMAMKNLYADALFYNLEELQSKLSAAMAPPEPIKVDPPSPSHRFELLCVSDEPDVVYDFIRVPDTSYPIYEALALHLIAQHGVDHKNMHFKVKEAIRDRPGWVLAASWKSIVTCADEYHGSEGTMDINAFFLLLARE